MVELLVGWCRDNNLCFNVRKTKAAMVADHPESQTSTQSPSNHSLSFPNPEYHTCPTLLYHICCLHEHVHWSLHQSPLSHGWKNSVSLCLTHSLTAEFLLTCRIPPHLPPLGQFWTSNPQFLAPDSSLNLTLLLPTEHSSNKPTNEQTPQDNFHSIFLHIHTRTKHLEPCSGPSGFMSFPFGLVNRQWILIPSLHHVNHLFSFSCRCPNIWNMCSQTVTVEVSFLSRCLWTRLPPLLHCLTINGRQPGGRQHGWRWLLTRASADPAWRSQDSFACLVWHKFYIDALSHATFCIYLGLCTFVAALTHTEVFAVFRLCSVMPGTIFWHAF